MRLVLTRRLKKVGKLPKIELINCAHVSRPNYGIFQRDRRENVHFVEVLTERFSSRNIQHFRITTAYVEVRIIPSKFSMSGLSVR